MAKTECCHNCVYACRDLCQAMASIAIGFPSRPKCANQPGHYGRMRPSLIGKICSNFRERPPEPRGDVKPILLTDGIYAYVSACDYEEISQYTWRLVGGGYAGRSEKGKGEEEGKSERAKGKSKGRAAGKTSARAEMRGRREVSGPPATRNRALGRGELRHGERRR